MITQTDLEDKKEGENMECGECQNDEAIEAFAGIVPDPRFCRRHGRLPRILHVRVASVRPTSVFLPVF